jgi:hypothetical protein
MPPLPQPAVPAEPGGTAVPAPEAVAWTASDGLCRPEGAYYDTESRSVYVSNAGPDGAGGEAGFLSKLAPDGRVAAAAWVTGLAAPRGLRGAKGRLYAACGDHLAVIDVGKAEVAARVPVPGAERLTGVAIDAAGVVYVSDPAAGRIHTWDGAAVGVFAEGPEFEHPNGLLAIGNQLFVAGWGSPGAEPGAWGPGRVFAVNLKTRLKTPVTPHPVGHLGGLERDDKCNFLVSDRAAGKVYRISPRGETTLLLAGVAGPAGHAFVPDRRLLVLPRTGQDCVTAYDLTKLTR